MNKQIKICLKTAWLVAAISMLFMGTPICVSTSEACVQAGNTMLTSMFLITFPTGIFFFFIMMIFVDPAGLNQPSDFITAWFIMMCGGLLQWFLMVPGFFEKPGLTTLDLKTSATLRDSTPKPSSEAIQAAPVSRTPVLESPPPVQSQALQVVSKRTGTRRKLIKSISAFDRTGRTPLERVIDHS